MNGTWPHVTQWKKMLGNLERWLEKGAELAATKKFEPNVLLGMRLAPDQYPLVRQIQAACDAAKAGAARLAGKEPPSHPDTETTMDEIKARLRTVITYLETFSEKDFDGAEERSVNLPFLPGKSLAGVDYLSEMANPNFFFHVTHAYAILRHAGVPVGKTDFIGSLNLRG